MQKPVPIEKWKPPEEGWVKVNVDGAISKIGEYGGAGVVFRNHEGTLMGSACHFLPMCKDPAIAKLQACKHAVQLAHEFNANSLHIEMDCKEIVKNRAWRGTSLRWDQS